MVQPLLHEPRTLLALLALAASGVVVAVSRFRDRRERMRRVELNRLVEERTRALAEQTRRAEAARSIVAEQAERLRALDSARSRFFANVSHEFRTPLTLIVGPLRDLHDGRLGELSDAAKREIAVVLESASRLSALVEQLLDIARVEAGELKLELRERDVVALLQRVCRSFRSLARARGVSMDVELPEVPVRLAFDADRLETVLTNLLGNAFKFTDRGGHVRLEAGLASAEGKQAFAIRIADDGIGIPANALERVFDRFFQVDDSPRRQHEGTGLGLALAKELVELHGGSIAVESGSGGGSVFTVRLPVRADSPACVDEGRALDDDIDAVAARESEAPVTDTALSDGRDVTTVLLVEDNQRVRAYLRRHLAKHYRVLEAPDGRAGLEQIRRAIPDVVISDVMMPDMDGQALVEAIRQDPTVDFVPVVMLTARASHESLLSGLRGGADEYVTKPFDVEELLLRLHNLISRHRRLRQRLSEDRSTLPVVPPTRTAPTDEASRFTERVYEILSEHIDEQDFDVQALAGALHISRSTLYRRTEQWLGGSPVDAISGFRLEQAARWLKETDAKVNEIAYGVGFTSVSHFSRKFRERFGRTPTDYRGS